MTPPQSRRRLAGTLLTLFFALAAAPVEAQDLLRSAQPWATIQTRWFNVHYPLDAADWAQDLAPRLDAMRDAVAALVGYAPERRTTIVIDDPYNVPNGKAIPLVGTSAIHLWVTPPGPTDQIANHRGWAMKLAAHEFAHVAHLSRPARRAQWWWRALPAQVSPIAIGSPRWATEGYATWIEGRITGSGRPHGAWRPALLRELALAGRLPSYGAMSSGSGAYKTGSLAYLAGSAFWEWLGARHGDSAMVLVFRRQTARMSRSFDDAFRGVYGDSPATLYARFAAELTAKSFAVDSALRAAGVVTGTRLARFSGDVGGPAVSRDGRRIALALPGVSGAPPRIIVAPPDTQPIDDGERKQVQRLLARDPQDVPARRAVPRLAKPIATLTVRNGRTFRNPRFINADGTLVLLESWGVQRDGSVRPDLAVWNTATGVVRFVTRNAALQDADAAPDGSRAVALRCIGGRCGLVLVTLSTGEITSLAEGSPLTVYSHPRFSPDGTRIVTSVQERDGTWRLAMIDVATRARTIITPDDDVNRHSPSFDMRGEQVVYVSESHGIPNVESLRLRDGARTQRTRIAGSAYEPTPMPGGRVLYLSEYAGGMELYQLDSSDVVLGEAASLDDPRLIPAMPVPRVAGVALTETAPPLPTPYRFGQRQYRWLGGVALGRDGLLHVLSVGSADAANRLTWMASGLVGTGAAWRGGVASAAWYGSRPGLRGEAFWLEQRATRQWDASRVTAADVRIAGVSLASELPIAGAGQAQRMVVSGSVGAASVNRSDAALRSVLTAQYSVGRTAGWRRSIGGFVRGSIGQLGDSGFTRASLGAYGNAYRTRIDLRVHGTSRATPITEQISAGGFAPPLTDDATLAQRIAAPALPVGAVAGRELIEFRIARPAPFLPATLYGHAVGNSWRVDQHTAVVGLERGYDADFLGIVGLPRLRVLGGVAQILRGPLRDRTTAYLQFGWRP